jgi:hypothetical protein
MSVKDNPSDIAIRLQSITIMETHKRGKRIRHPQFRNVTGIEVEVGLPDGKGTAALKADVVDRQFSAKLEGSIDITTGVLTMNVVDERVTSYLKKKRFRVMGYSPEFRITNTAKKEG